MRFGISVGLIALAASGPAVGQADVKATAPALDARSAFTAPPEPDDALGKVAGKEDLAQIARAENSAVVAKNSVGDGVVTGEVRITDNAFQNMSGLSMVNVNTGNNVAMNASMNVNIAINAPQ